MFDDEDDDKDDDGDGEDASNKSMSVFWMTPAAPMPFCRHAMVPPGRRILWMVAQADATFGAFVRRTARSIEFAALKRDQGIEREKKEINS